MDRLPIHSLNSLLFALYAVLGVYVLLFCLICIRIGYYHSLCDPSYLVSVKMRVLNSAVHTHGV